MSASERIRLTFLYSWECAMSKMCVGKTVPEKNVVLYEVYTILALLHIHNLTSQHSLEFITLKVNRVINSIIE